jgi:Na+-transporting methylmalonyl-CoA/oxaloacetate decarboxylase gamma subunit
MAKDLKKLRPVRGLFRKQDVRTADDDRIKSERTAEENALRGTLAQDKPRDRELFLEQAKEGYQEQDRRGERSERRATTLLASITVITTVVGATSGILASSEILKHGLPRFVLGVAIFFVILCFAAAAIWALRVITLGDHWRRTSTPKMLDDRLLLEGRDLYVHAAAALMDSIRWNQCIADNKAARMRNAARWFGAGLALLIITVTGFLAASTIDPAETAKSAVTIQTVQRPANVRVVIAARVLHTRRRGNFGVRYAVTARGVVDVSIERDGKPVSRPVSESADFGPNTTVVKAPRRGRYLLRVGVRATNGTTSEATATLLVR